ncbi:MAG: exodeoxyribonuclease III [Proteobacteria bacterium]|nr:MAG: exodeoxyribonuclease III [Pseudomonadota bacterium]
MTKIISWNVNGIRAALKKGFMDFFEAELPDILCLQETKAQQEQVELDLPGYHQWWNSAEKKGYSGTAIFSRFPALSVSYGLGIEKHDKEGRVITVEFEKVYVVTVYTPNSQDDLRRLPYRHQEWDVDFLEYVNRLQTIKPVIFCGDLNVAHKEIDLANPKTNTKSAGFTPQERLSMDNIISSGFVDSFRHFNQEPQHYTWWSYRTAARERNVGWRIDYFCVSEALVPNLRSAGILPHVHGSDHCPVVVELNDIH